MHAWCPYQGGSCGNNCAHEDASIKGQGCAEAKSPKEDDWPELLPRDDVAGRRRVKTNAQWTIIIRDWICQINHARSGIGRCCIVIHAWAEDETGWTIRMTTTQFPRFVWKLFRDICELRDWWKRGRVSNMISSNRATTLQVRSITMAAHSLGVRRRQSQSARRDVSWC